MNRSFGIELEIANITRETSWMRGSVIRVCSPEAHVEDLIAAGFLTRIK
ncbi:hypothetical protein [Bilophila wadsworthia]|nr:hypothetical protein [Bilophila wadsworthia]